LRLGSKECVKDLVLLADGKADAGTAANGNEPKTAADYALLGQAHLSRGEFGAALSNLDEAIRMWNRTLAISPALVLVRQNLATALLRTGRPDQAQGILRKALEFNPSFQPATDLLNQIVK